jgi:hypothetical protein
MTAPESFRSREWVWALLLLALGVGARVFIASYLPTLPVSDFQAVVAFALNLRDKSLFHSGYHWDVLNLGPPLVLSVVMRVFPEDPVATARFTTAVWCGLLPVFPFLFWRRVLPLWVRVTAGLLLALWPGQVFFSGVVAQDNWVLVPAVALACLAVPPLLDPARRHPLAAGLLYALGVAMRQEMLFVLLPPLVAAAGFGRREGWRPKSVLACALAIGLPFLALALQRQKATGKFALSSGHAGVTLLGTVAPGATSVYWKDPGSYIASVEPDLLRNRQKMFAASMRLALEEVKRRPGFQALRVVTMAIRFPFHSDRDLLYWSVVAPGTLPATHATRVEKFSRLVAPFLLAEMIWIQTFFLAALFLGLARRNRATLIITLAILLKMGLHAVLVSAARFYLPATALELPVIALGLWEASRAKSLRAPLAALACGGVLAMSLAGLNDPLYAHLVSLDVEEQRTYRFAITSFEHPGVLRCTIREGRPTAIGTTEVVMQTLRDYPAPGDRAAAECTLTQPGPPIPLAVRVLDSHEPGGAPGRMIQRVEIDGRELVSHDVAAEPGTSWQEAPAGLVGPGREKKVLIEVLAGNPESYALWGPAASARIRIVRKGS